MCKIHDINSKTLVVIFHVRLEISQCFISDLNAEYFLKNTCIKQTVYTFQMPERDEKKCTRKISLPRNYANFYYNFKSKLLGMPWFFVQQKSII